MVHAGCERRPNDAGDLTSPASQPVAGDAVRVERRVHRSRVPAMSAVIGFVVATMVADALILAVLGDSVIAAAVARNGWFASATWRAALAALRDPSIALAAMMLGGVPGALAGHRSAVRRLRRDRLDALLHDDGPRA